MVIIDSNTGTHGGTGDVIDTAHPSAGVGHSANYQSFTMLATPKVLTSCIFSLLKSGAPAGNMTAHLYSHAGTYGVSSVPNTLLATSTSQTCNSLGVGFADITFVFPTPYTMSPGTRYVIEIDIDATVGPAYIRPESGAAHGGNYGYYQASAWVAQPLGDLYFIVNGVDPPAKSASLIEKLIYLEQVETIIQHAHDAEVMAAILAGLSMG